LIFVASGTVAVQVVTFGDSNTDFGFSGANPTALFSSYVSNAPSNGTRVRLGPDDPNSSLQLAGKIEARWRAARPDKSIRVANHGISGTTTGAGRDGIFGTPNALEAVNGVTRFQGEVLGFAYPWSGGEPTNSAYPNGPVLRIQAFSPRNSDFAYILLGTNDVGNGISINTILANLETMIDQWIALGRPANHIIIATLPPRPAGTSGPIPSLNDQIRSRFGAKGARVLSLDSFVSNDKGLTWKSTCTFGTMSTTCHVGDSLHMSEVVRDWIADNVVSIMSAVTPP
jgi:lysophospholipase L1-like esterase